MDAVKGAKKQWRRGNPIPAAKLGILHLMKERKARKVWKQVSSVKWKNV